MGIYRYIKAAAYKTWKMCLRYRVDTVSFVLRPLMELVPLIWFLDYIISDTNTFAESTGTVDYRFYLICSTTFLYFISNSLYYTMAEISDELQRGNMETLWVMPIQTNAFFGVEIVCSMVLQFFSSSILFVLGCVLFQAEIGLYSISAFFFGALLSIFYNLGLGILLAGVTLKTKLPKMAYLLLSAVSFLAGEMYPVTVFPAWLQVIAYCNPLTWLLDIVRFGVMGTTLYLPLYIEGILAFILCGLCVFWGLRTYKSMVWEMKQNGNLTTY